MQELLSRCRAFVSRALIVSTKRPIFVASPPSPTIFFSTSFDYSLLPPPHSALWLVSRLRFPYFLALPGPSIDRAERDRCVACLLVSEPSRREGGRVWFAGPNVATSRGLALLGTDDFSVPLVPPCLPQPSVKNLRKRPSSITLLDLQNMRRSC